MSGLEFDLDVRDDIEFVHQLRLIVAGVLLAFQPREAYLVKIDNWFGDRWLGFSHKLMGAAGVHYRHTLRVPPFVPARVVYERHFRRVEDGEYVAAGTTSQLHVEQSSEANARRLMSAVCANAAVFWWSGETRANQRGALMAYLPTSIGTHRDRATEAQITRGPARRVPGHVGWHADFKKVRDWKVAKALCTTASELSKYAATVTAVFDTVDGRSACGNDD